MTRRGVGTNWPAPRPSGCCVGASPPSTAGGDEMGRAIAAFCKVGASIATAPLGAREGFGGFAATMGCAGSADSTRGRREPTRTTAPMQAVTTSTPRIRRSIVAKPYQRRRRGAGALRQTSRASRNGVRCPRAISMHLAAFDAKGANAWARDPPGQSMAVLRKNPVPVRFRLVSAKTTRIGRPSGFEGASSS